MQIINGMFYLSTKYNQFAIAIVLKKMVQTVAPLYFWLPMLSNQVVDLVVPELSYKVYQNSDWYGKIVFFLLVNFSVLNNLSHTKKKRLNTLVLNTG